MAKKRRIRVAVCAVALVVLALVGAWLIPERGKPNPEYWSRTMRYTGDYARSVEKEPGRDFKILIFSDVHLNDTKDLFGRRGTAYEVMEKLAVEKRPDLIIFLGDTVWAFVEKVSVRQFVRFMDKLQIPWAAVMGNHESEMLARKNGGVARLSYPNWVADRFMKSKYCLFKKGPNNIGGVGNYVLNITENGKVVKSLILMDSHAMRYYEGVGSDYDFLRDGQLGWYRWVVEGLKAENGGEPVESLLFMHIPLPEFEDAYDAWEASGFDPAMGFGVKKENCCPGYVNSGMFGVIKELGSTKYVFSAHDHVNNYSVEYEGVRLTYGTKTGDRCYWDPEINGGTLLSIGDAVKIEQCLVPAEEESPDH